MCFVSSVFLPLFESLKSGITELNRRMWEKGEEEFVGAGCCKQNWY